MPSTSIAFGALLILIGILGYLYGVYEHSSGASAKPASWTALIPAIFGILLLLFGFLARSKENLRKHLMHAAVVVALLGVIAVLGNFARTGFNLSFSAAVISNVLTGLICLVFVILSVKSFMDARK